MRSRSSTLRWLALVAALAAASSATAGNLGVVQAAASSSNTTANILIVDSATANQPLPITTYAVPGIRVSGSATSTLYASTSDDGSLFTLTGANSADTSSNVNTLNPRAVVRLDSTGTVAIATTYTGGSGNQTRSATSVNNINWYIADQGGAYTNGTSSASPSGNFRSAKSFAGIGYLGQQSSTASTIQIVSLSAPSGGSLTAVPGLTNNSSFQDFYFISSGQNGTTHDVLYVLSSTSATVGTITKYSLSSGSWVAAASTYSTNAGGFALAAESVAGSGAVLYFTTGTGATTANRVVRLTDSNGWNANLNITSSSNLYTTPAGTILKGVAFAPVAVGPSPATQLAILPINGGNSPTVNAPFDVHVQSRDALNGLTPVSQDTTFQLSVVSGTGSLGGTLSGTILANQSSATLAAVTYDTAQTGVVVRATRTAGDALTPGTSTPFSVQAGADHLAFVTQPSIGSFNSVLGTITVRALRPDNTIDTSFNGTVTISNLSGPGGLSGTLQRTAVNGVVSFTDLREDAGGDYVLGASAAGLTSATSASIRVAGLQEILLPQYIAGNDGVGSNTDRIPYAFRVSLSFLQPNATYRYFNQVVLPTDADNVSGAGNVLFADPIDFDRTSGPSLASSGDYAEFTTDADGSYTGWFATEPTGNARFSNGNQIRMRVMLNDGANGISVAQRITTVSTVTAIDLGNLVVNGTGVRGNSAATPRNFVFLWDNIAGAGRPIAGTFVEADGSPNTTANSYVGFYANLVDDQPGSWGAVIPNDLTNGVRRIESRSFADATTEGCAATDDDGMWPSGANTASPTSGTAPVAIAITDAPFNSTPIATCRSFVVVLGANGIGALTGSDIDGGSSDLCGIASLSAAPNSFTCIDLGSRNVTLTVTNVYGVSTSCDTTVSVVDLTAPTINTPAMSLSVECDGAGNSAPLGAWVASNGGADASDSCSSVTWSSDYSGLSAGCGATGSATVTFTATDASGNVSSTSAVFAIEDLTAPELTAVLMPRDPLTASSTNSACAPSSRRVFDIICSATDRCDGLGMPVVEFEVTLTNEDCSQPSPLPVVDTLHCGDAVEIQLLPPQCATNPRSAAPVMTVNSQGITVITGEAVTMHVTATDACLNASSIDIDPAQQPSPACPNADTTTTGTCCAPIAAEEETCTQVCPTAIHTVTSTQ